MKIKDIDWGEDSAERDSSLLQYFIVSDSFDRLSRKSKSIVIGRKGAGKSALRKKLEEHFGGQAHTYVVSIAPKYNSIRAILNDQEIAKGFAKEIFFQHTWLRQILLDALCIVGHMLKGSYAKDSEEFARKVSSEQNRTSKDFVENITDIFLRLKVKAGSLGELGINIEKELRNVADVDALEHHLVEIAKQGAKFVILIDDLDLGWDNSSITNNMLLGLLAATNYLAGRCQSLHPIIFLREDVYTILLNQTQHADKYRNIERLQWNKSGLIRVLNARINYNRNKVGLVESKTPFLDVFPETIGTANTDNWLVERTLSRPRELLQLVRHYSESVDGETPSDDALKNAEVAYSSWKLDDLCSEYSNQYPGLISIMAFWKTKFFRCKYHLKRSEVDDMLLEVATNVDLNVPWYNEIVNSTDLKRLLLILYEVGFIGDYVQGGQGGSKTYYSFEDNHEPRFEEIQIHPCFRRAVNTVERIRT